MGPRVRAAARSVPFCARWVGVGSHCGALGGGASHCGRGVRDRRARSRTPPRRARTRVRERIPFCGAGAARMAWGWTASERTASTCRDRVQSGGGLGPTLCVYGVSGSRYGAGGAIPRHAAGSPCRSCDPPVAGLGPGAGRWDPMCVWRCVIPTFVFWGGVWTPCGQPDSFARGWMALQGLGPTAQRGCISLQGRGWIPLHIWGGGRGRISSCVWGVGSHYMRVWGGWIPLYVCMRGLHPIMCMVEQDLVCCSVPCRLCVPTGRAGLPPLPRMESCGGRVAPGGVTEPCCHPYGCGGNLCE